MHEALKQPVNNLSGISFDCTCGRCHGVPIDHISIGPGIYTDILHLLSPYIGQKILLVADIHTYDVLGKAVETLLKKDFIVKTVLYREAHLHPDEKALGRLFLELGDAAYIVTVGSGTLNDITRFISGKTGIPYAIVGTAPSMDGYASVTSALLLEGVKMSVELVYPKAIIGDTTIMKNAPMHMLHAGLGDIIGKYTALSDWRTAHRLTGEYYCDEVASLVENAIEKCVRSAEGLAHREEEPVYSVLEGLILSGIAIGMVGTSRPAAGEEHNLAHCWEMLFLSQGRDTHWLHGNLVGVATGVILEVNRYLSGISIDTVMANKGYLTFDIEGWKQAMQAVYGGNAAHLIAEKLPHIHQAALEREEMAKKIGENWDYLCRECFNSIPSPEHVKSMMEGIGAVYHPADIGLDRDTFRNTLMVGKDMRVRYGILQVVEDLGLMDIIADHLTNLYYGL